MIFYGPHLEAALPLWEQAQQQMERQLGRQGLRAARVELMVAPLLSSGDPTSPPYLRSLYVLLAAARSGPATEVVLPGALGDDVDPQADSRFVPDAPDV